MNKSLIPTPHINAKKEQVAKVVLMPGDPLRAKYIAENYLQDVTQINSVRNMLMFTGKYKNQLVTVAASGMGMASIGIYSYELFKFYDVDCIIRIGSGGSYQKEVNVYDIVHATGAYSESNFAKYAANFTEDTISSSANISSVINQVAQKNDISIKNGLIHSTDVFYRAGANDWSSNPKINQCLAVEMEAFALFTNAKSLNKSAACLLTISDSLITKESLNSDLRATSFNQMMLLALESAFTFLKKEQ